MRPPPPIADLPRFPIVGGTALLAIGASLAFWKDPAILSALTEDPHILLGEYWRLLTSILIHIDPFHLIFNVYWLWVFGTLIEDHYGHLPTLGMVVLFAAGSGAAEYAFLDGGVGLSGVGYGFFGMIWALSRFDRRFRDVIDRRTVFLFIGWFFFCIVTSLAGTMPVANIAHGVGALLGWVLGAAIGAKAWRVPASLGLVLMSVAVVFVAIWHRPWTNLSKLRSNSEIRLGNEMSDSGQYDNAMKLYDEAVKLAPERPGGYQGRAHVFSLQGRFAEAEAAAAEAAERRLKYPEEK